jgi:hypothetical protein
VTENQARGGADEASGNGGNGFGGGIYNSGPSSFFAAAELSRLLGSTLTDN